jgi:hypothetical protein
MFAWHPIAGKGNAKGSLDGVGKKLSAEELKAVDRQPEGDDREDQVRAEPPMKAYPNLPAADVDARVACLQTLK